MNLRGREGAERNLVIYSSSLGNNNECAPILTFCTIYHWRVTGLFPGEGPDPSSRDGDFLGSTQQRKEPSIFKANRISTISIADLEMLTFNPLARGAQNPLPGAAFRNDLEDSTSELILRSSFR